MLIGYTWNCEDIVEEWRIKVIIFAPFISGSETKSAKPKIVRISSRIYSNTCEECVELFNFLVEEKVKYCLERAEKT